MEKNVYKQKNLLASPGGSEKIKQFETRNFSKILDIPIKFVYYKNPLASEILKQGVKRK